MANHDEHKRTASFPGAGLVREALGRRRRHLAEVMPGVIESYFASQFERGKIACAGFSLLTQNLRVGTSMAGTADLIGANPDRMHISLFRPQISEEAIHAAANVLRSGWLGLGPRTEAFENAFAAYTGSPHCVGLNSDTSALHLAVGCWT